MIQTVCPKCQKQQGPTIDPKTDKIFCSLCNQEIAGNYFLKTQLKACKQYKQPSKNSFSVKCQKCNKDDRPLLINDEIVCSGCKKKLDHLTDFFKDMLRKNLAKADEEI